MEKDQLFIIWSYHIFKIFKITKFQTNQTILHADSVHESKYFMVITGQTFNFFRYDLKSQISSPKQILKRKISYLKFSIITITIIRSFSTSRKQ